MKNPCFLFTSLMTVLLSATTLYADNTVTTNTVLNATDILGLEIIKCSSNFWCSAEDVENLDPVENPAIQQSVSLNGVQIQILYSEFPSTNLAINALILHKRKPLSINFEDEGIWDGAMQKIIGDTLWHIDEWSWFDGEYGSVALLLVSKTTCLMINTNRDGDEATQKSVCEQIALKIVEKITQGSHVIVSDENPPPQYKPAPSTP